MGRRRFERELNVAAVHDERRFLGVREPVIPQRLRPWNRNAVPDYPPASTDSASSLHLGIYIVFQLGWGWGRGVSVGGGVTVEAGGQAIYIYIS